jgi:Leucine-rich repeat (LRR) protein
LQILYCGDNQIKKLYKLPDKLKVLCCIHNKIQELDDLPNELNNLICCHNEIKKPKWFTRRIKKIILL